MNNTKKKMKVLFVCSSSYEFEIEIDSCHTQAELLEKARYQFISDDTQIKTRETTNQVIVLD